MEDTHRKLEALGYHGAVLVPGNRGLFDLYAKFGYRPFCDRESVTETAASAPIAVTPCTPEQYLSKRPDYLEQGSVFQDATTFHFLSTYAEFYKGEDFLFCGGMDDGIYYFQEFLGNADRLPGILKALGAQTGQVLLPGKTPSAMYLSLDGTEALPRYFGIALS